MLDSTLVQVLVWVGTITFAVTGALRAVERRFDIVGVFVLAGVTAIGGGSVRDLLAGRIPPPAITDEPLLWAVAATALAVFFLHGRLPTGHSLWVADTASLGLFAGLGALTGVDLGFGFWGVVFAGTVSGVGGGMIRDVLAGEVPRVLSRSGDFYASAAAAGAAVTWGLAQVAATDLAVSAGALVAVAVRVSSRAAGLHLPVPRDHRADI